MRYLKLMAATALTAGSIFAAAPASAQTIGFKVGPTFSQLHSDGDNTGLKYLTSFGGGGFLRFGMAGLSMQGEVLAMTKGLKIEDGTDKAEIKLTYLEVPILARFALGTGMVSPYIMVGPSFAYELSCSGTVTFFGATSSGKCDNAGEESDRNKFDIGATGVAGLEFKAGPGALLVEGRYTHGLLNINKNQDLDGKANNRSFAAMVGYAFSMK